MDEQIEANHKTKLNRLDWSRIDNVYGVIILKIYSRRSSRVRIPFPALQYPW